jgi:hypothetical protein
MKPYIAAKHQSHRPGCQCCIPGKSGHGKKLDRHRADYERAFRNGKRSLRQQLKRQDANDKEEV